MGDINKRISKRIHPNLNGEILSEQGHVIESVKIEDLSSTGVGFSSILQLTVGSKVMIRLTLHKKAFDAEAEILWASLGDTKTRYGARFLRLDASKKSLLRSAITALYVRRMQDHGKYTM